mmetsp:Transcript_123741/g.395969  ORF Transcript_123741/g.395969 Transcript_123741/m.395969 type:complete len:82 (-) Transcript_123741:317-562(-)
MRLRAARAGAVAGRKGAGAAAFEGPRRRKQELQEEIQARGLEVELRSAEASRQAREAQVESLRSTSGTVSGSSRSAARAHR